MTHIEWGGYGRSQGTVGGSLLVAYTEGAPVIDVRWVEERNAGYYSAREERNAERRAALGDPEALLRAAEAIAMIRSAGRALANLLDYGGQLHVARTELGKLVSEGG